MRKHKKKEKHSNTSMIGKIIDLPMDEFKKELDLQEVNVGTTNNTIMLLCSIYHDMEARKDAVMNLVFAGEKTREEVEPILSQLYSEMMKVEEKVTYLRERVRHLLEGANTIS